MRLTLFAVSLLLLTLNALAQDQQVTVKATDGTPVLVLTVAKDAKVLATKDMTAITSNDLRLYLWVVPAAKTVADAVPLVADIIKSEFIKFEVTSKTAATVAGADATHLTGKGKEADDQDPGNADVIVFTAGNRVFVACIHGEDKDAEAERAPMLAVLKTAKAP